MADWDQVLDCEGLLCPLPVLRARKRLAGMAAVFYEIRKVLKRDSGSSTKGTT